MNKHKILELVPKYTAYLAFFFLIVGGILALVVENKIPALISFCCLGLCVTANIFLSSYFYYKNLDLEKGQKKGLFFAFIFEIIFWGLMCFNFFVLLLSEPSFIYKTICYALIILFCFASMFFGELEGDKHDKGLKIFICIVYTISIIVACATSL